MKTISMVLMAIILALLVISCDLFGGGEEHVRRALPDAYTSGMAISYSGFRTSTQPGERDYDIDYPTLAEIREDLEILEGLGFSLIRLYSAGLHEEDVLQVIAGEDGGTPLNLKVQLGAWISGPRATFDSANMEQLEQAAIWAKNAYKDIIVAVSVGNETLVDWQENWSVNGTDIAYYVKWMRNNITQPVTVNDNFEVWTLKNEEGSARYAEVVQVLDEIDFVSLHTYAFWDAQYIGTEAWDYEQFETPAGADRAEAMMDAALGYTKENYWAARDKMDALGYDMPIVIGETGWMSNPGGLAIGHGVNEKMFYDRLNDWVFGAGQETNGPDGAIFFEAFDEPWKGGDDGWGLFNVEREAKYVVYGSDTTGWGDVWDGSVSYPVADDPEYTAADAAYVLEPYPLIEAGGPTLALYVENDPVGTFDDARTYSTDTESDLDNILWEPWDGNYDVLADTVTSAAEVGAIPEGSECMRITPIDDNDWGWGMMVLMERQGFDLNAYSSGSIEFDIRTDYGVLEMGFQGGLGGDQDSADCLVYVDLDDSAYVGAADANGWQHVTLPVSVLTAAAEKSYGASGQDADLTPSAILGKVYVGLVIADRWGVTGFTPDTSNSRAPVPIYIDNVVWKE